MLRRFGRVGASGLFVTGVSEMVCETSEELRELICVAGAHNAHGVEAVGLGGFRGPVHLS